MSDHRIRSWWGCLVATIVICGGAPSRGHSQEPSKHPLILAHYMPWYVAKPFSETWGWHWTMNAFDPEKSKDGKRAIASHYYPLIGPYDSGDPAVIEYHLLLMKLAGIDGVIVDWYGLSDHLDYAVLHRNTESLVKVAGKYGLRFAICYEDQTIPRLVEAKKLASADRVEHARSELDWLRRNWFSEPRYVRLGGSPLFLSFGYGGLTDKEWEEVFRGESKSPLYVSEHRRRSAASGAFDWPIPKEHPSSLDRFYTQADDLAPAIPVAYPRFHDAYEEGKSQKSHGRIQDEDGRTWAMTLERAFKSKAPVVQLATWNDWGEGTGIEPTVEFGYRDLEMLQRSRLAMIDRDFAYTPDDLRLADRLLRLRRQREARRSAADLDKVAQMLAAGSLADAKRAMKRLENQDRE